MGCDIHCYIEYVGFEDRNGDPYWQCFGGRYNPGRDYNMFELLAGVRGDEGAAVFAPRGLPEGKLSWEADGDAFLRISDEYGDQEGYCTSEAAEGYEKYGCTIDNERGRVEHPDWHSHSWLTPDEYAQVIGQYLVHSKWGPPDVGYEVILDTLRGFESRGKQARLVFWFDN